MLLGIIGASRHHTHRAALTGSTQGMLAVCATEIVTFGLVLGLALLISRASRDDLFLRWRRPWLTLGLGAWYSIAIRMALGFVGTLVCAALVLCHVTTLPEMEAFIKSNKPDLEAAVSLSALKNNPVYAVLSLTLVSFVVAGLREELWRAASLAGLRRLWPRLFGSRVGGCLAAGLIAIVFGFGHLPMGMVAVAGTALIGWFLGCIMVLHRSTWMAVIAHGMFDAATFAAVAYMPKDLLKLEPAALLHCIPPLTF